MSIAHRNRRVLIYSYVEGGNDGFLEDRYVRQSSGDADHAWWGSVVDVSGTEVTIGGQAQHNVDVVIGLGHEAPVTVDSLCVVDGTAYKVAAVLERKYGIAEKQVLGMRTDADSHTLVNP